MTPFQHLLIWKYCVVFGTFFNDIIIERGDSTTPDIQKFKVPIEFGPIEKYISITDGKPTDRKLRAIQLPRMTFELTGMSFDGTRKQDRRKFMSSDHKTILRGAPWNLNFRLSIMSKNLIDATKIVEQILFMFQPDYTVDVKLIDEFPEQRITTDYVSINHSDDYEGPYTNIRRTIWDIDFVMKAWLFGPVDEGKQIKKITLDTHPSIERNSSYEELIIVPGLTANGEPTTDLNETVPYQDIEEDDNYDIISYKEGPKEGPKDFNE